MWPLGHSLGHPLPASTVAAVAELLLWTLEAVADLEFA